MNSPALAGADSPPATYTGVFADGATYLVEVPANWNHTLLLYSHGLYLGQNPAQDAGDPVTKQWLLDEGYALAGSSYASTGWAIESALADQINVLDTFDRLTGRHPDRTIAWGHSMGGLVTAGLIQANPGRFNAAMPLCGWVSGGPAVWNEHLDGAFAFKTLVSGGSALELARITNPGANIGAAETLLAQAQGDPAGRARIALVSALTQLPGWGDPASPEPAAGDYVAREYNQYLWNARFAFPITFLLRAQLEARAGGNPSWNTGVDYREQLRRSGFVEEVESLYATAGLSLERDLDTLGATPRISADPPALAYLVRNVAIDGTLNGIPVLTVHGTGDGLVPVSNETAYAQAVDEADRGDLQQLFVHRAGHCTLTVAETITAFKTMFRRLNTGSWGKLNPDLLNEEAATLGPSYNQLVPFQFAPFAPRAGVAPAFLTYRPAPFLRPFPAGEN
jgi:pimeloyl-ACP methyl ester carboxylesterase